MAVENAPITLGAWLLTYALHSTVLIGGAWLAALVLARYACRRSASGRLRDLLPELRERAWKLALLGGLCTATLQTSLGLDPWGAQLVLAKSAIAIEEPAAEIDRAAQTIAQVPESVPSVAMDSSVRKTTTTHVPAASTTPVRLTPAPATSVASDSNSPIDVVTASQPRANDIEPVPAASLADRWSANWENARSTTVARTPLWIQLILWTWAAIVAIGIARWACQWNALLRNLDDRTPITSGPTWDIFQRLRRRSGSRAHVELMSAPGISAPITLGIRRLQICLPPRAETELQEDELAALLAHELAHAERRDPAWLALCRALEVVFFFQPLNRICGEWLQDEAEYLCDDWAVVQIGERVPLASCLTEIAGWIVHEPQPRLAPAMAARGTRLSLRVRRLLDDDHEPSADRRARWLTLCGLPAAACVALLVPGVAAEGSSTPEVRSDDVATSEPSIEDRVEHLESESATTITAPEELARTTPAPIDECVEPVVAHARDDGLNSLVRAAFGANGSMHVDAAVAPRIEDTSRRELVSLTQSMEALRAEMREHDVDDDFTARFEALECALAKFTQQQAALEELIANEAARSSHGTTSNAFTVPLDPKEMP